MSNKEGCDFEPIPNTVPEAFQDPQQQQLQNNLRVSMDVVEASLTPGQIQQAEEYLKSTFIDPIRNFENWYWERTRAQLEEARLQREMGLQSEPPISE